MRTPSTTTALRIVAVLLVVLVVSVVVAVVVVVRGDDTARTPPAPAITDLAALSRADLAVPRGAFCDRVDPGAVGDALAGQVMSVRDYENGDTAQVDPTTNDVAHEFGCTWTSTTGTVVRAWIFAPPVTRARAKILSRTIPADDGCTTYPSETFGDPGTAFACTGPDLLTAGHGGLFGDAWLSCTVAEPVVAADAAALQQRADSWCVAAAVGAATPDPQ